MEKQKSPLPAKLEGFGFIKAIEAVIGGNKVRRNEWPAGEYINLSDGFMNIFIEGKINRWIIGDGDINGQDWVIIP